MVSFDIPRQRQLSFAQQSCVVSTPFHIKGAIPLLIVIPLRMPGSHWTPMNYRKNRSGWFSQLNKWKLACQLPDPSICVYKFMHELFFTVSHWAYDMHVMSLCSFCFSCCFTSLLSWISWSKSFWIEINCLQNVWRVFFFFFHSFEVYSVKNWY